MSDTPTRASSSPFVVLEGIDGAGTTTPNDLRWGNGI